MPKKAARVHPVPHLSEGSPADHFEHLEVVSVKAHLLHGGCEWLHCEERRRELVMIYILKWTMDEDKIDAPILKCWQIQISQ